MNRLKDIWSGQDDMNRVLLLIAVAVFVWSLIEGHGMYGALLAVVVLFLMVSRHGQRIKRFGRLYGTLYFPMPDGELVPRTFEQVKTEYLRGAQGRYAGRAVELRFPWWYLNSAGEIDTGFGLTVRLSGSAELLDEAKLMRRGDCVRLTGTLVAESKNYFCVGEVETLERISEKDLYPLKKK